MNEDTNVVQMPQRRPMPSAGGNGDGTRDLDARLRAVELDVREIKTQMQHVALQKDVLGLKIWILIGVIGGMLSAAGLAFAVARLFFGPSSPPGG